MPRGQKQEYLGRLAGPFPIEAVGSFQGLLVKGNKDLCGCLSGVLAEFCSVETFDFKDQKGGASNWRQSRNSRTVTTQFHHLSLDFVKETVAHNIGDFGTPPKRAGGCPQKRGVNWRVTCHPQSTYPLGLGNSTPGAEAHCAKYKWAKPACEVFLQLNQGEEVVPSAVAFINNQRKQGTSFSTIF